MSLPFKPHIIALLCSAGLLAAAGTLYVQSRTPATIAEPPAQQAPAPAASTTQPVAATYTQAQIDQWVAPIALYPDSLLSQVLMASTYPDNVLQAVQWSQDNPAMKGDAAVQAVASQPWDPSVKSLVAFPALLAMMGENPPWVENLGNAFLAQPHDVMDSVQRLRAIAQQTGTLKSTPQQQQRREAARSHEQNRTPQQQQRRQQFQSATPAQRQQTLSHLRANALSGNESRAPSWQAQQERGLQSRQLSGVNRELREGARERLSEHHELRRR
ncbi:TPA: DUF3300 domain-containing protein [Klebsiella pneumoniae]